MNRIHWRSPARHGEIQVKEFDLEQTTDVWIVVDLEAAVQAGAGDDATVEVAVRAAASIADKAIRENRAVGMTVSGHRRSIRPADRGSRQRLKILQLLAAVDGDGTEPLVEPLVATAGRLRRGMTTIVVTPSLDPAWVRPLATFRGRGINCIVVLVDAMAHDLAVDDARRRVAGGAVAVLGARPDGDADPRAQRMRAIRHALAEYEIRHHVLAPERSLAESLAR
jgi:uncharacterized protein (DUF58 family)